MPWPLALAQKQSTEKKQRTKICQELEENTGRRGGGTRETDGPAAGEPPGTDRDMVEDRGW